MFDDVKAAVRVRVAKGLRGRDRLKAEIDAVDEALWQFAITPAYDAGVRWALMEAYLLGLTRAARWTTAPKARERD
jgi:hypothetical protein